MNDLDKSTIELMEQLKRMIKIRPLYLYEWVEYCNILKMNISLGLNKEIKSKFLEFLLRDDYVMVDDSEKEVFLSMKNSLFQNSGPKKRLKPNK